jgi:hypothetical protein
MTSEIFVPGFEEKTMKFLVVQNNPKIIFCNIAYNFNQQEKREQRKETIKI